MHLDVGEVDFASHIHVPAVIVLSHLPSDVFFDSTGHAAALKGLPPGLVESQFLDRRCSGRQLVLVRKLVTHEVPRMSKTSVQITRQLAPPPDSQRPSKESSC